jgi:hypothetical protein
MVLLIMACNLSFEMREESLFSGFSRFVKLLLFINWLLAHILVSLVKLSSTNSFFNAAHVLFCMDNGVLECFSPNWLVDHLVNHWLLTVLCHNIFSFLYVSEVMVVFCDDGKMLLFNHGGMFFVDNGLMVLMDVFFIDDWLVMLMNNVLMMLMEDILLMLNEDILVMLMDDILMDFLHYWLGDVALDYFWLIDYPNLLAIIN